MAVPKYNEMYEAVLISLKDNLEHPISDIRHSVKEYLKLSDEDVRELLKSGSTTVFYNRVGWACTFLKKAGVIESPKRASYKITDEGLKVLAENPDNIDDKYFMKYKSFKDFYYNKNSSVDEESTSSEQEVKEQSSKTPDDILQEAFEQINNSLADDLLEEVMKISPRAFERFVLDLMAKMGYGTVDTSVTTSYVKDDGIDGIILEDKLGFNMIFVQAKQWDKSITVGKPEIQRFVGAISGKQGRGLFVTTSKYSKEAIEYANNNHIILIDGMVLANYMIEYNFCVSEERVYVVKRMDSDAFNNYDYK